MNDLDASAIRRSLSAQVALQLDDIEVFHEIDSTNTYLLQQSAPDPGRFRVALADHQTAGRGRHRRNWLSPPGAGLCLSTAYTFASMRSDLPNVTLALGVAVVRALSALGIEGIKLKWPNDIVALDGKLGGMLTEVRSDADGRATVVAGIGLNFDVREQLDLAEESGWAHRAVDLKSVADSPPPRGDAAAVLVEQFFATFVEFEKQGFDSCIDAWRKLDWLHGRSILVDTANRQVTGTAAGVDVDGALLIDTQDGRQRVISGSITLASLTESVA